MKKSQIKYGVTLVGATLLALCISLMTGCSKDDTSDPATESTPSSINISKSEDNSISQDTDESVPEFSEQAMDVSPAQVAFEVFRDGQIAYITANITNTTSIVGEEGILEFVLLDDNDQVVASQLIDAPILFPGSYVVSNLLLDETKTGTHAEVRVDCVEGREVDFSDVEVADCTYTFTEDNGDGTMTVHWDETYTTVPDIDDPTVMNTLTFYDADGNLVCATYVVGGCYGSNGQVADVYADCPITDFETVEIHCYLMH